jgi:transposase InsO family protein
MDFIDLAERKERKRYCLVLIDRFTRWVEAFSTTHCDAKTVAKLLVREIPRFGVPEVLSADNGTHFTGDVVKQVAIMMGVDQNFVSIYHPPSNGVTERANQSIKQGLAKACHSTKKSWVDCLPLVLRKMRSSFNKGLWCYTT